MRDSRISAPKRGMPQPQPSTTFGRTALSKAIRVLMFSGVSAGLMGGQLALAQSVDEEQANSQASSESSSIEEVEVQGIRSSLRSAIDRKKNAGTMSDSLVAEDIGEFPDKNVGEALQRVTGVQIDRDFGEGAGVSIRGVEPDLVRVELNGVSAMGMGDTSRGVDFRDMAAELVKSLDVIKGSEARIVEGGIGGTIKVNTRKPNDFKDNYLKLNLENQYNDLTGINDPRANITGVYKFSDDFGVLVNVTGATRTTMIHALRNTEWVRLADYDGSAEKTFNDENYANITDAADCPDATCQQQWFDFSPRIPRYGIWQRDEDRLSANVMAQYQFNDNLSGHIGYTANQRDKASLDRNLQLDTSSTARIDADSVVVDGEHNVTSLTTTRATLSNRTLEFAWEQETSVFDAGLEYTVGNWDMSLLAGSSRGESLADSKDTTVQSNDIAGIVVSLDERGAPTWDLSQAYKFGTEDAPVAFDLNDPASYWDRADYHHTPVSTMNTEDMLQFDSVYNFDGGFFTKFRTGLRYATESIELEDIRLLRVTRYVGRETGGREWTLDDQINLINNNSSWTPDLFEGFDLGTSTIGSYLAVNTGGFIDDYISMLEASGSLTEADLTPDPRRYYEITTDSQALYLQGDFATELAGMPVWGNVGARYVRTNVSTFGDLNVRVLVDELDDNGDPIIGSGIEDPDHPEAFAGRRSVKNDYGDFLPSLNVNLGIIPDQLVLYAGVAKVMARPKASDLNIAASCTIYRNTQAEIDQLTNNCSGGNPALDPYRANQFDVALSWYPDSDSIVSLAYFQKEIESFVLAADEQFNVDYLGDGNVYDVKQPLNGEGVTTRGIEFQASTHFSMLPAPFDGLGGSFNFTHMTSDNVGLTNQLTGEELPFPAQSENSYNISTYYETDNFSARLAYNYRDEYLASAADRSGNPVFVEDAGFLDAKITYSPNNTSLKFYMDAQNLLEQEKLVTAGPHRLSDLQWAGRVFSVGVTYSL